jgi:uncharacterized protein YcnI
MFVLLSASAAGAHVTAQPATAEQGGRYRGVFRVPNESDTASTVEIQVQFPKDAPTATSGVRVAPKAGWTVDIKKDKLDQPIVGETSTITEYVSEITWTAQEGTKIGPGYFDEFDFTTGALPKDKATLAFKVIQTYDGTLADGTTEARWVEERKEGAADPKRPEAIIKLSPPTTTGAGATATPAATGADASASESGVAASDAKSSADSAKNLGVLGIVLAIVALLVAGAAIATRPKAAAPARASGTNGAGTSTVKDDEKAEKAEA